MIQLKRVLRHFPAVFCVTLVLVGAVALVAKGVLAEKLSDDKQTMVEVGVCGDIQDSYLGIGILALQQLDSSRFAINFHMMEEEEAKKALSKGELTAYLVVPDGFVDSVVRGENYSIKYYAANGEAGIGTMLMHELAMIISELITKSQSGIYGMQSLCKEFGYYDIYWDATNELNLQYINLLLDRPSLFDVEILGVSNQLSMQGYYICGFAVLFFMLFGINGCPIFVRKDMSMARILKSGGMGAGYQVLIEWLTYLCLVFVCMLSVFALLGGACEHMDVSVPEWRRVNFDRIFSFGVSLIPTIIMLTSMAFLLHELTDNIISGMLLQFLVTLGFGYVSGCFYPSGFFPEGVQLIGKVLPSGVAIQYAAGCMKDELGAGTVMSVVAYTVIFVGITWLLRRRKLMGN